MFIPNSIGDFISLLIITLTYQRQQPQDRVKKIALLDERGEKNFETKIKKNRQTFRKKKLLQIII